jgi:iron complex outermembrane receptor protein
MSYFKKWFVSLLTSVSVSVFVLLPLNSTAQVSDAIANEVVVQSGRLEQSQFDAPGSITVVNSETLRKSGPQVNLSDALTGVPGVVSLNRNNYAQDVAISIRGFGARSAFGLRGIRLITDGIPATIPDGQGQSSTVSFTSADRIEVLTGPLAQIYGNSSGGVIQTFTREAGERPELRTQTFIGSFGMNRTDWQISERTGQVGLVADYSTFAINGYRQNSDARRQQLNTVVTVDANPDSRWKLIANLYEMPYAKDALGLTQGQLASNPAVAGAGAVADGTRKNVGQNQLGLTLDQKLDRDLGLSLRAYSGMRNNLQYQASSQPLPPSAPNPVGTWVGLWRHYEGLGAQLKGQGIWSGTRVDWVVGVDRDHSGETRQGGATLNGIQTATAVNRNELNSADNTDFFAQANWYLNESFTLVTGLRRSNVSLRSQDYLITPTNPDGSGAVNYSATNPVLGLTWHAQDNLNVYANFGHGLETPTLSEVAYRLSGNSIVGQFNPNLAASTSHHVELGTKLAFSQQGKLNLAWFQIDTSNEIVASLSSLGQTAYTNASKTHREGIELAAQNNWTDQFRSLASSTFMKATYAQGFSNVNAGNSLPALANNQFYLSTQWSQAGFANNPNKPVPGLHASLDWLARSKLWANDANTAYAPGYGQFNAKIRQTVLIEDASLDFYLGIDNLSNKNTVGSVIINQAAQQYFEPGLPRNWVLGLQTRIPL